MRGIPAKSGVLFIQVPMLEVHSYSSPL